MAPALTSEAATRARDKLPVTTPLAKICTMNHCGSNGRLLSSESPKPTESYPNTTNGNTSLYIINSAVSKSSLLGSSSDVVPKSEIGKLLTERNLADPGVNQDHIMCIASESGLGAKYKGMQIAMGGVTVCSTPPVTVHCAKRKSQDQHSHSCRLLQRIRRLQSRQTISHTKQQLVGFVAHQNKNLEPIDPGNSGDFKPDLLKTKDVKNLSTAALVNLVHKLQSSQPAALRQHLSGRHSAELEQVKLLPLNDDICAEFERVSGHLAYNLRHLEKGVDSDATESSSGGESCDEMDYDFEIESKQSKPSVTQRAEWRWALERASVAARWTWLQAQVSDLEYRIRQQNDIYRQIRASKGAVVLGDQPAHDEKSRNQQRGGRRTGIMDKGNPVEQNEMSPCDMSTLLSNVARQSSQVTQQLGQGGVLTPLSSPSESASMSLKCSAGRSSKDLVPVPGKGNPIPNGLLENTCTGGSHTPETKQLQANGENPPDPSCQASRCRPVRSYRKRKLLRTTGLHLVSRKAARMATIKCHCYPPFVPCALCGGRYNNVMSLDPEVMPLHERVALLDSSFHPVLSFGQDVPLSVHFESLLKSGRWQHKPPPKSAKVLRVEKKRSKRSQESVRKYSRRLNKGSAVVLSSTKIKNKYDTHKGIRRDGGLLATPKKHLSERTRTRLCRGDAKLHKRRGLIPEYSRDRNATLKKMHRRLQKSTTSGGTPYLRDTPFPLSSKEAALRKRRGESAFDINNIVIPYSIAAATRVEKLQYKEILTPRWRRLNDELSILDKSGMKREENGKAGKVVGHKEEASSGHNGLVSVQLPLPPDESDEEDISNETFISRHIRCEEKEKKRFASYAQFNKRGRGSRTDSGTHTPDPISPEASLADSQIEIPIVSSLLTTSTTTKADACTALADDCDQLFSTMAGNTTVAETVQRRRSSSLPKLSGKAHESSSTLSWVKRQFPIGGTDLENLYREYPRAVVDQEPAHVTFPLTNGTLQRTSHPESPASGSSTSSVIDEDPDDPEWTIVGDKPMIVPKSNSGLVLKLAKR